MRSASASALVLSALIFCSDTSAISIEAYDYNNDKVIDSTEFRRFILDKYSKPVSGFDENGDGVFDAEEIAKLNAELELNKTRAEIDWVGFSQDYPNGQPIAAVAVIHNTEDAPKFKKKDFLEKSGVLIRQSPEDLTFGTKPKNPSTINGALLSYSRDMNKSKDVLTAKGAILRPFRFDSLPEYMLIPSAEFNRLKNEKDRNKDVDSLIFRAGNKFKLDAPWRGKDDLLLSLNPAATTDFDFELDIRSLEFAGEPIISPLGLGASYNLPWVSFRSRFRAFSEWGKVYDDDDRKGLKKNEDFARIGPDLGLSIWPNALPRLVGNIGYNYLKDVAGDLRSRNLFTASVTYSLDLDGNVKLETKYTNGDTSAALENEESVAIGLSIKY